MDHISGHGLHLGEDSTKKVKSSVNFLHVSTQIFIRYLISSLVFAIVRQIFLDGVIG